MSRIFVYGSLRHNGFYWKHLKPYVVEDSPTIAYLPGNLYAFPSFPAVTYDVNSSSLVEGEIYTLIAAKEEEALSQLDHIEGFHPTDMRESLYHRCQLPVRLKTGEATMAYVYVGSPHLLTNNENATHIRGVVRWLP